MGYTVGTAAGGVLKFWIRSRLLPEVAGFSQLNQAWIENNGYVYYLGEDTTSVKRRETTTVRYATVRIFAQGVAR